MNAFEAGTRRTIPAVLIYARAGEQILMIHRNTRGAEVDFHSGRWNGLGGKLEVDESPRQAAAREFREESGVELSLERFEILGLLQFPNFKPQKQEDWLVWVLECELSPSEMTRVKLGGPLAGAEGTLHWIDRDQLLELNLWPGDKHFLPLIVERRRVFGTLWYEGGDVRSVDILDGGPIR